MSIRTRQLVRLIILSVVAGSAVWALLRFTPRLRHLRATSGTPATLKTVDDIDLWNVAVQKVKEDRGEPAGGNAPVEVPTQLRHYSDTHWFLATQIAEVRKLNVATCQDFNDLAALLKSGEIISVPAVTDSYVLLGVGGNADDSAFTRFQDDHSVGLYDEAQLHDEYSRIESATTTTQREVADLNSQLRNVKERDRAKRRDLQKQISARQQQLASLREDKARLDQSYGNAQTRDQLVADYQQLQMLAKNFAGRSYNLDDAQGRQAFKVNLLRSLRPEAFRVMEQLARKYHENYNRPLPVSSLVRPEDYQHDLHKVNRNAVLIDTPPHSTGLAFDIDYRYMSAAEQSFLMSELARMKDEGTIEVIRERNANYHVFVFLDGKRPNDDLIAASLEAAGAPQKETHHAEKSAKRSKPAVPRNKPKARPRNRKQA